MLPPLPPPEIEPSPEQPQTIFAVKPFDDPNLSNADILDERNTKVLRKTLDDITSPKTPSIHPFPAPQVIPPLGDPQLQHHSPPASLLMGRRTRDKFFERRLNSTLGRFVIFCSTIAMFNLSIYGLVNYARPEYVESGKSFIYFWLSLAVTFVMYTMPIVAERAGMKASETGWKPYLVMYRCSFFLAIFALVLQILGAGQKAWHGDRAGPTSLRIQTLQNKFWNWFELADGFVALNLTKGITETPVAEEHGIPNHRRISRFRDSELRVNREPFSDVPDPTPIPGTRVAYSIAPVFSNWAYCATRYRISANCLQQNPVRAWAFSKSDSLCTRYGMVACKAPKPVLKPKYQCSQQDGGIEGIKQKTSVSGLCGRVTKPPPDGAVDELAALLKYDSWSTSSLPKATDLWIDVSQDDCISDPQSCEDTWSQLHSVGLLLQIIVNLMLSYPLVQDCRVDYRIREARQFMEQQERINKARQNSKRRGGTHKGPGNV